MVTWSELYTSAERDRERKKKVRKKTAGNGFFVLISRDFFYFCLDN